MATSTLKGKAEDFVRNLPWIGSLASSVKAGLRRLSFRSSSKYWEGRYAGGGTSGGGSEGALAAFKAEFLNAFVLKHNIQSIVEFGCGDGRQLSLANYPRYVGLDVSKTAISMCQKRFENDPTKSFFLYDQGAFVDNHGIFRSDAALSLDVLYHLVEDRTFETYMTHLFGSANRYVVIYSSNRDEATDLPHVRHRHFTNWIQVHRPQWTQLPVIKNKYPFQEQKGEGSFSDFFVFQNTGALT